MRLISIIVLLSLVATAASAQHLRIFACAIANDSTGAFLGGSSNGSGLYQSDDTGKTWKHLGWDNIKCYSMDEVESSNGRILYEATGLGVLRSNDYGEHWKQLTDWRISEAMDVAVNQKNPNEIYIATAHGPWRTEDGGKAWDQDNYPFKSPYCSRVKFDSVMKGGFFFAGEDGIAHVSSTNIWSIKSIVPAVRDIEELRKDWFSGFGVWNAISERDGLLRLDDSTRPFRLSDSDKFEGAWCTCTWEGMNIYRLIGGKLGLTLGTSGIDYGSKVSDTTIRNISSCLFINTEYREKIELAGTLDNGIVLYYSSGSSITPVEFYLPHRQIWTLKSVLVTP